MLAFTEIFNFPIYVTTQNKSRLGETVHELDLDGRHAGRIKVSTDKTRFSMVVPEVLSALKEEAEGIACVIVGIESHVCVLQTTKELLALGYPVYVLADGVSSCNKEEIPIALRGLQHAGATITTSESLMFEITADAGSKEFKAVAGLIKQSKDMTREAMSTLCKI